MKNALLIDYFEAIEKAKTEFRIELYKLILKAYEDGVGCGYFGNSDTYTAEQYAKDIVKDNT